MFSPIFINFLFWLCGMYGYLSSVIVSASSGTPINQSILTPYFLCLCAIYYTYDLSFIVFFVLVSGTNRSSFYTLFFFPCMLCYDMICFILVFFVVLVRNTNQPRPGLSGQPAPCRAVSWRGRPVSPAWLATLALPSRYRAQKTLAHTHKILLP